jgi:hypothetical protein
MADAVADNTEPRMEKAPIGLSAVVPAQEAQGAIRRAFPYEGDLRVRHLWSADGFSRFRANWFREEGGKTMIVKSLFLCVTRTTDDLAVQNETAVR